MKKTWTVEEEEVLLRAVKDCPNNLKLAFNAASQLIDRSVGACSNHWYTVISKRTDKASIAFASMSSKTFNLNRKNCKTPVEPEKRGVFSRLWERMLQIFCVE